MDAARGFQLAPGAGLADAGDALVGFDADVAEAIDQQRLDFGDLHDCVSVLFAHQAIRYGASTSSSGSTPMPGAFGALTVPSSFSFSVSL